MPLYLYECTKCNTVSEVFKHNSNADTDLCCNICNNTEFKKLIGKPQNRVLYNARENYSRRLQPEVDRIMDNVAKGKDKDFLDIAGE